MGHWGGQGGVLAGGPRLLSLPHPSPLGEDRQAMCLPGDPGCGCPRLWVPPTAKGALGSEPYNGGGLCANAHGHLAGT